MIDLQLLVFGHNLRPFKDMLIFNMWGKKSCVCVSGTIPDDLLVCVASVHLQLQVALP